MITHLFDSSTYITRIHFFLIAHLPRVHLTMEEGEFSTFFLGPPNRTWI